MTDREKLIMLLGDDTCHRECSECEYHENESACIRYLKESMADHLLANGVTVQNWIPVTERLPKEWVEVLVWSRCGFHQTAVYIGIPGKWRLAWNHVLLEEGTVTHWMPRPKPPEDGGAENG